MKFKSKLFASAVAFSMVLSAVAIPASAATTAELTAQINALLAQIAQLQAQISGGATTGGTTFTTDLTVGSKGAEVTALQTFLVSNGNLVMPAGVAMGYFGSLTKAALAKYQASVGISPAAGYFGPITRAKVNAAGGTTTSGTTTTTTGITTPGAEGTMTVTSSNAGVVSNAYAGDTKDKILGFKVQALNSDIAVQRVKASLGTNTDQYNKIWSKYYVLDEGGNTLASLDSNSTNVVKDSGTYYITLSGFSSVVPKGTTKQFYVAADLYGTIDSAKQSATAGNYTVALALNGVRGVDGAGIDQYSPASASTITSGISVGAALTDSATLTVGSDSSTPKTSTVVANQGSANDQYDQLPLLVFTLQAKKDSVKVTDATFCIAKTGTGAAVASSTLYLYDGSTVLGSGTVAGTGSCAVLSNVNFIVPKDTTKSYTIKADVRSADITAANFAATASSTSFTAESSNGTSVTAANKTGSITGNTITVRKQGIEIALNSKSITTAGVPQSSTANSYSTSTLTATFNFRIKAVGAAITFGTAASGTPAFASSTTGFKPYVGGAYNSSVGGISTSTSWSFPSNCSTSGLTNSCTLSENDSMDVAVTYQIFGRNAISGANTSGLYSIGVEGVQWQGTNPQTATFMSGLSDWRTADVSFP